MNSELSIGAQAVGPLAPTVISAVLVIGLIAWSWLRSGSPHLMRSRLWLWLFGKPEEKSDLISKFLDERDTLMRFRVVTGIQVGTTDAAERMVLWIRRHNLDIDLIDAVGHYFDPNKPGLRHNRPPSRAARRLAITICFFLCVGAVLIAIIGRDAPPAIRVVKSGNWYAVEAEHIRRFAKWWKDDQPKFSTEDCSNQSAVAKRGFDANDVSVICDVMTTPVGKETLDTARKSQLGLAAVAFAFLTGVALKVAREIIRGAKAEQLHKLVNPKVELDARPKEPADQED